MPQIQPNIIKSQNVPNLVRQPRQSSQERPEMMTEEISTGPQINLFSNRRDLGAENIHLEEEKEESKIETSRKKYLGKI